MSWLSEALRFLGVLGCGIGARGSGPARGRGRPSRPRGLRESARISSRQRTARVCSKPLESARRLAQE
eukprot:2088271-Heterocapsa_arctica.AAC.1